MSDFVLWSFELLYFFYNNTILAKSAHISQHKICMAPKQFYTSQVLIASLNSLRADEGAFYEVCTLSTRKIVFENTRNNKKKNVNYFDYKLLRLSR